MQTIEHTSRVTWQPLVSGGGELAPMPSERRSLARPLGTSLVPAADEVVASASALELIADDASRNIYLAWTLRISAIMTPLALLLSWHFELREAALISQVVELGIDAASAGTGGWPDHDSLRATIDNAQAAALLWTRLFNVSAGALAGTAFHALIDHRAWRLSAVADAFRWHRRRHRLLSVRHPSGVSSRLLLLTVKLAALSVGSFHLSSQWYTSGALPFRQTAIVCGVVLLLAATVTAGRATSLTSRVPPTWTLGASLRFLVAAGLFGVGVVASGILLIIGIGMLMFW